MIKSAHIPFYFRSNFICIIIFINSIWNSCKQKLFNILYFGIWTLSHSHRNQTNKKNKYIMKMPDSNAKLSIGLILVPQSHLRNHNDNDSNSIYISVSHSQSVSQSGRPFARQSYITWTTITNSGIHINSRGTFFLLLYSFLFFTRFMH